MDVEAGHELPSEGDLMVDMVLDPRRGGHLGRSLVHRTARGLVSPGGGAPERSHLARLAGLLLESGGDLEGFEALDVALGLAGLQLVGSPALHAFTMDPAKGDVSAPAGLAGEVVRQASVERGCTPNDGCHVGRIWTNENPRGGQSLGG